MHQPKRRMRFFAGAILCGAALAAGCSSPPSAPSAVLPPQAMREQSSVIPRGTAKPRWNPPVRAGSYFVAVQPPLSDNTARGQRLYDDGREVRFVPATSDSWFYLVNGDSVPTPLPDASRGPKPTPSSSPILPDHVLVLTATDQAPSGATAPNGGQPVVVAPLGSSGNAQGTSSGAGGNPGVQLWKLAATSGSSSGSGTFFLRSSESFSNPELFRGSVTYPNMLTGIAVQNTANGAPNGAKFDLGAIGGASPAPALYLNAASQPLNASAQFETWSYNPKTAQIVNANGSVLYADGPVLKVGSESGRSSHWYAYPNYIVTQVVDEKNSSPAFPKFSSQGQRAAYAYISVSAIGSGALAALPCSIEGKPYAGIRCQYVNLNAGLAVDECAILTQQWIASHAPPPSAKISTPDWSTVLDQIHQECADVAQVRALFANFDTIFNYIFESSSSQIPELAYQVGSSIPSQQVKADPVDVVVGVVGNMLKATKVPGAGAVAELMNVAVKKAQASPTAAPQPVKAEAAQLYATLGTQFLDILRASNGAQTSILSDWGRLKQIGPLTLIDGPNGLAITPAETTSIEQAGVEGYSVYFMQQIMPLADQLEMYPAQRNGVSHMNFSATNPYGYSAFGSQNNGGMWSDNESGVVVGASPSPEPTAPTPSPSLILNDVLGNGADAFTFFNGLNGWGQMGRYLSTGVGGLNPCDWQVVTIANNTPQEFSVNVDALSGSIAAPGSTPTTGKNYSAALMPFGYVTIYGLVYGSNSSTTEVSAQLYLNGSVAAQFDFEGSGCDFGKTQLYGLNVKQKMNGSSVYFWPSPNSSSEWPWNSSNITDPSNQTAPESMYLVVDN
jgi:hypothetical protein